MPYPFTLPTTGSVLLSDFFESVTHPSLPLAAATQRSVVRDVLKQYKRLPPQTRPARLPSIQDALTTYLSHLLTINSGIGYNSTNPLKLDIQPRRPLSVSWRSTLSQAPPGRDQPRVKLTTLDQEILFTLSTLAHTHSLQARVHLRNLPTTSSGPSRVSALQSATKHLSLAHSIHVHTLNLISPASSSNPQKTPAAGVTPVDIHPSTLSGLASLALAEATLLIASKDDPHAAAVAEARDKSNTDWMFRASRIEKSRASLMVRICMRAAELASESSAAFASSGKGLDEGLRKYAVSLGKVARARAARFGGVQAEMEGGVGVGIAWLKGAKRELLGEEGEVGKKLGGGLRREWKERREGKKVERDEEWGLDAGIADEVRVVEVLEGKWTRENEVVNVQVVPESGPLMATLPSGRSPFVPNPYVPAVLDESALAGMRAPPDPDEAVFRGEEEDSGAEDGFGGGGSGRQAPAGAFPGMEGEYGRSATSSGYY